MLRSHGGTRVSPSPAQQHRSWPHAHALGEHAGLAGETDENRRLHLAHNLQRAHKPQPLRPAAARCNNHTSASDAPVFSSSRE